MTDDDLTRPKRPPFERPAFYDWGVAEMEAYVAELRAEIERTQAAIAGKTSHRAAAESVFGTPKSKD